MAMIKLFVVLYPSVSNRLLLKMQIMKILNPHPPIKGGILFVIFVQNFHSKFSGEFSEKHLEKHGCGLSSLYSGCNEVRLHCFHTVFFVSMR